MRVIVTGGAGFIGSHIVDQLTAAAHEVAIVDNLSAVGGSRRSLNPNARLIELDIRDSKLTDAMRAFRPDVVCHQAAQTSVAASTADPLRDAGINVMGLINTLEACARAGAGKVVLASSAAIYGTPRYLPLDEQHPANPESPYGISKSAGERYLAYYAAALDLRFTILRYANVYGPRQNPYGEAGVIAIFCHRILRAEPIRIDWDGEQRKDYVYVTDVARANLLALGAGANETYNIGTSIGTSVNALHKLISQEIGRDVEVSYGPRRPGDIYESVLASERARRYLAWEPQVLIADGIAGTVEHFRRAP